MAKAHPDVRNVEEFNAQTPEYQEAVRKIVRSHAVNELYGARVFDEPAITYAPNPYAKWLTCRVAMEEYGHHYRFAALGRQIGVPEAQLTPEGKEPLSIFGFEMTSWEDFCAIKLLADLAEIIQVEDLVHCSFHPLRNLARLTMPEEKFHSQFGEDFCAELVKDPTSRAKVQDTVARYLPLLLPFFGAANSENNELFRRCGIKLRSNEDMRADYVGRVTKLLQKLGLAMPALPAAA